MAAMSWPRTFPTVHVAPPAGDFASRKRWSCARADFQQHPLHHNNQIDNNENKMPPPPQTTAGGSTFDKSELVGR